MTKAEFDHLYFEWMYRLVCDPLYADIERSSYRKLFTKLHGTNYDYILPMDANQLSAGLDLRYRFVYETGRPYESVQELMDGVPCSMLEMIIALAYGCEGIMANVKEGCRLGQWVWIMLSNLGIAGMNDERYDEAAVNDVLYRFIHNLYEPDGKGGLFWIENCKSDLRRTPIWMQACWYLDAYYGNGG